MRLRPKTVPAGNPRAYSPSGDRILISHQSSTEPADLWIYNVATRQSRQVTFSAVASLTPSRLPASQLVHYKSFDAKTISAFLWVPYNLKRDGTNPGIVLPHGGPTGQTVDNFNKAAAALASRGLYLASPRTFRGASVELFGITDWLTEQEHEEPALQQYDQSILGDPVKDRKSYEDASPIKYFKNAKAPLLILQG